MQSGLLIYPLVCFVVWIVSLYALLTVLRAPVIWNLKFLKGSRDTWEERELSVSANLSNQFEWPTLFLAICVLLMSQYQTLNPVYIWSAWIFLIGRAATADPGCCQVAWDFVDEPDVNSYLIFTN